MAPRERPAPLNQATKNALEAPRASDVRSVVWVGYLLPIHLSGLRLLGSLLAMAWGLIGGQHVKHPPALVWPRRYQDGAANRPKRSRPECLVSRGTWELNKSNNSCEHLSPA